MFIKLTTRDGKPLHVNVNNIEYVAKSAVNGSMISVAGGAAGAGLIVKEDAHTIMQMIEMVRQASRQPRGSGPVPHHGV